MRRSPLLRSANRCCSSMGAVVVSILPAGATATTPSSRASAICMRPPPHDEMIPFVPPLVPGVVHELAHERDPQTAGLAVVERAAGVRRGSEQRVERICSIYDLHRHELVVDRERQVDRGPLTSETVTHNIRKDLVERQQEPPRGAL